MEMDSSRGLRKLIQLDERVPASFHPTFECFPTDLCSRLKVLTTLITPCNFPPTLLNSIIPTLSHLNFVQSKLTGPPLTRPPTTRPCHRTCPSGASWPLGNQRGSCPQFRTEWMIKRQDAALMKCAAEWAAWMKMP